MGQTIIRGYNGGPVGVLSSKVMRPHFHFEKTILATEVSEMPKRRKAGAERKGRGRRREIQVQHM